MRAEYARFIVIGISVTVTVLVVVGGTTLVVVVLAVLVIVIVGILALMGVAIVKLAALVRMCRHGGGELRCDVKLLSGVNRNACVGRSAGRA